MNVYLDITLLPSGDIETNFLLEKVYQQIHLRLVNLKIPNGSSAIGVSFPNYNAEKCQLGTQLRLFAESVQILENFNAKKCLSCLSDYVHITSIRDVPSNVTSYIRFKRKQSKSNTERLARRKAIRENIELEQACQLLKNRKDILINLPFVRIVSSSSKQSFRLFIMQERVSEQINDGFSCYGLSASSTVPYF